jgi:hypothetical protein
LVTCYLKIRIGTPGILIQITYPFRIIPSYLLDYNSCISKKSKSPLNLDRIRWGYRPTGDFSLKEAYHLVAHHPNLPVEEYMEKIWKENLWPKVATFLWQVAHKKILTWDHLCKKGFQGTWNMYVMPSNDESMDHLLNSCSFNNTLWDQGAIAFANLIEIWTPSKPPLHPGGTPASKV